MFGISIMLISLLLTLLRLTCSGSLILTSNLTNDTRGRIYRYYYKRGFKVIYYYEGRVKKTSIKNILCPISVALFVQWFYKTVINNKILS